MNIFVSMADNYDRKTFFNTFSAEKLAEAGKVRFNPNSSFYTEEELIPLLNEYQSEVLVTGWGCKKIGASLVKNVPSLKLIAHTAGTVGPYVSGEVFAHGIKVLSGNRIFAESVAECCLGYAICALRKIPHYTGVVRCGGWIKGLEDFQNKGLMDRTVGLIGFGDVAKSFVRMLQPFHVRILACAPELTPEIAQEYGVILSDIDEIFETSDIVSVHASLNETTRGMIDKRLLSKMQDGALFLNTARGAIVREEDLIRELETGRINAALDVYETEPLAPMNRLRYLPNVIAMPHMGGPTLDRRPYVVASLAEDIRAFAAGNPLQNEISYEQFIRMMH